MKVAIACLLGVVLWAGCQKSFIPPGAERGDCRIGDGSDRCDPGLLCLSDLCVRPPPADCGPIADKLASFELGNYAPRAQRDKLIADKRAACTAAYLSREEGECIAHAADKWAAAKCAPSMFPGATTSSGSGDCGTVIDRIAAAMPNSVSSDPSMRAQFTRTMDVMRASCAEDGWPDDLKKCVLAAPPGATSTMQQCNDKFPKALQDKMTTRLMDAMQKNR
jgi:hypothetical protein